MYNQSNTELPATNNAFKTPVRDNSIKHIGGPGAGLKHGIRNPETETESRKWQRKRKQQRKRNTESNINDRKIKNFTIHNLVQSKENLS